MRESIKEQLNAALAEKALGSAKDSPFAAFGAALASTIADKAIDALVTPEGLARLARAGEGENDATSAGDEPLANASGSYEALDRFEVRVQTTDAKDGAAFVLRRRGLGTWVLTAIRLPPDTLGDSGGALACAPEETWDGSKCTPKQATVSCPAGSEWNGTTCMSKSVACPSGSAWDGVACQPASIAGADSSGGAGTKTSAPSERTQGFVRDLTNEQAISPLKESALKKALGACFKREIETNPHLFAPGAETVVLVLSYLIESDGRASSVQLDNAELRGRPIQDCVKGALTIARWPRFDGERKRVSVPFNIKKPK